MTEIKAVPYRLEVIVSELAKRPGFELAYAEKTASADQTGKWRGEQLFVSDGTTWKTSVETKDHITAAMVRWILARDQEWKPIYSDYDFIPIEVCQLCFDDDLWVTCERGRVWSSQWKQHKLKESPLRVAHPMTLASALSLGKKLLARSDLTYENVRVLACSRAVLLVGAGEVASTMDLVQKADASDAKVETKDVLAIKDDRFLDTIHQILINHPGLQVEWMERFLTPAEQEQVRDEHLRLGKDETLQRDVETKCHVTARIIRSLLTPSHPSWTVAKLDLTLLKEPVVQINFRNGDHWVTCERGRVWHSLWKQHALQLSPLSIAHPVTFDAAVALGKQLLPFLADITRQDIVLYYPPSKLPGTNAELVQFVRRLLPSDTFRQQESASG